jgi:hypothetical protein
MIIKGLILLWIAKDRTSLLSAGALIAVKGTHIVGGCMSTLLSSIVMNAVVLGDVDKQLWKFHS